MWACHIHFNLEFTTFNFIFNLCFDINHFQMFNVKCLSYVDTQVTITILIAVNIPIVPFALRNGPSCFTHGLVAVTVDWFAFSRFLCKLYPGIWFFFFAQPLSVSIIVFRFVHADIFVSSSFCANAEWEAF